MPSGSKKRKAAKKKKQQEADTSSTKNNNTNNTPLGNDDPKTSDERESDGGDAGSPASQDLQDQQHPFDEGNKESEKRDPKSSVEVARDIEGTAKVVAEGNGAVKIQRELESKDDWGGQNISIEHVEFVKESNDGSSSSSSSSDSESQAVEKESKKAIQGTEKESSGKADDSVVENAPAIDSVKPLVTAAPDLVESRSKENEELKRNVDEVIPLSEESVEVSWTLVEPATNENEGKSLPISAAPESSNGAKNTRDSKITVSSENQPLLASAPREEERTSWMSCCGLFDVLTGSSR